METKLNTGQLLNQLLQKPVSTHAKASQHTPIKVSTPAQYSSQILENPQKFLQQNLTDKLNATLEKYGLPPASQLKADDFTPEKVSERILGFVGNTIRGAQADGANNDKLNSLFKAAQEGISKGFADAKDILDSLDVLNGKVADDIDKTSDLLTKGMDDLYQQLFGPKKDETTNNVVNTSDKLSKNTSSQTTNAGQVKAAEYASYQRQDSFSFQLTTQQGDVVTLKFQNNNSAYDARSFHSTAGDTRLNLSSGSAASSQLSFEVEGDLNDDELAAINQLVSDVSGVADDFFANDIEGAFEAAKELGFDNSQIAGFNLNLQRSETTQYAQTYQRTGHPHLSGNKTPGPIQAMANLAQKFANDVHKPSVLDQLLPSKRNTASDMLNQLVSNDSRYQQMTEAVKEKANQALQTVVGSFTDQFLNQLANQA